MHLSPWSFDLPPSTLYLTPYTIYLTISIIQHPVSSIQYPVTRNQQLATRSPAPRMSDVRRKRTDDGVQRTEVKKLGSWEVEKLRNSEPINSINPIHSISSESLFLSLTSSIYHLQPDTIYLPSLIFTIRIPTSDFPKPYPPSPPSIFREFGSWLSPYCIWYNL